MGEGDGFFILFGNQTFFLPSDLLGEENPFSEEEGSEDGDPRQNGSNFYNRQWNNALASDRKNNLFLMLPESEMPFSSNTNTSSETANFKPTNSQFGQTSTQTSSQLFGQNGQTNTSNTNPYSSQSSSVNRQNGFNGQNGQTTTQNGLPISVNQTIDDLISTAKEHKNFVEFRNQSEKFWDNVRQMSEVRIVEKYVNGNLEQRAVSRYSQLLDNLNNVSKQGGQVTTFLNSLSSSERPVFEARHLLNQTLGASELFVGKGVVIDKSGQFAVREFLANNGKNLEGSLNTVLGFLGGKLSEGPAASLLSNGHLLMNAKTAALLSLSLALYQNINTKLPLTEALPLATPMPQAILEKTTEIGGLRFIESSLDNSKINVERRSGEVVIAAALINGALVAINKRDRDANVSSNSRRSSTIYSGRTTTAGAVGAMLGAVIGCVVPLAETSVGTALGFAASVVVGSSERGLRRLSTTLLISDVITSGVQTFLNASANLMLTEKPASQDLLEQRLLNNRTLAYLFS